MDGINADRSKIQWNSFVCWRVYDRSVFLSLYINLDISLQWLLGHLAHMYYSHTHMRRFRGNRDPTQRCLWENKGTETKRQSKRDKARKQTKRMRVKRGENGKESERKEMLLTYGKSSYYTPFICFVSIYKSIHKTHSPSPANIWYTTQWLVWMSAFVCVVCVNTDQR